MKVASVLLVSLLAVACDEKPKTDLSKLPDAATSPAVDPDLKKAVDAVGKAPTGAGSAAAAGDGPPETGVFAPGRADRELAHGAPAKLTLGGEGTAPRVLLTGLAPIPGKKLNLAFTIARGLGGRPGADMNFKVSLEAAKPKEATDPVEVLAQIAGVDVPGAAKEEAAQLAKLKGSKVRFGVQANGASGEPKLELPKGAEDLGELAGHVVEAIVGLAIPYPDKAVGQGGFWMTTTRETVLGVDTVTYRIIKVSAIVGDAVSLDVTTKRYAASDKFETATLVQFQSTTTGSVVVTPGAGFPTSCTLKQQLGLVLQEPGKRPQQLPLQIDVSMKR